MTESNKQTGAGMEFIETGPGANGSGDRSNHLPTFDLLVMAILGVTGGFISQFVPFDLLIKTWYPLVGGTQLTSGHHILFFVISYGLTRRKYAIMGTAAIKGTVMMLLGAQWGLLEVGISLYEGFFLVCGFWLLEACREKNTYLGYGLAAGIGNVSQVPFFWILTEKLSFLDPSLFVLAIIFGFASGVFFAGALGKSIVDLLHRSGVV